MSAVASGAIDAHEPIAVQLLGGVGVRVDDREMGLRDIGGTKVRHLLLAAQRWGPTSASCASVSVQDARSDIDALLRGLSRVDAVPARGSARVRHLTRGRRPARSANSSPLHRAVLTR